MDETNVFRPQYRELTEEEKKQMNDVKDAAYALYNLIDKLPQPLERSPNGRYYSLAKTSLEESAMWAVKGITT